MGDEDFVPFLPCRHHTHALPILQYPCSQTCWLWLGQSSVFLLWWFNTHSLLLRNVERMITFPFLQFPPPQTVLFSCLLRFTWNDDSGCLALRHFTSPQDTGIGSSSCYEGAAPPNPLQRGRVFLGVWFTRATLGSPFINGQGSPFISLECRTSVFLTSTSLFSLGKARSSSGFLKAGKRKWFWNLGYLIIFILPHLIHGFYRILGWR